MTQNSRFILVVIWFLCWSNGFGHYLSYNEYQIERPGFRYVYYTNGLSKEFSGSLIMNYSNWTGIAMHLDNLSSIRADWWNVR